MKRLGALAVLSLALAIGTPRTAAAQWGFMEWLASLDPGPAHLGSYQFDIACVGTPSTLPKGAVLFTPRQKKVSAGSPLPVAKTATTLCSRPEVARLLAGVDFGIGAAAVNPAVTNSHIGVLMMVPGADWNNGYVELGGGYGVARLWQGGEQGFGQFSRVAEIRVSVRPAAVARAAGGGGPTNTSSATESLFGNLKIQFTVYVIWNGTDHLDPLAGSPRLNARDIVPMLSIRLGYLPFLGGRVF